MLRDFYFLRPRSTTSRALWILPVSLHLCDFWASSSGLGLACCNAFSMCLIAGVRRLGWWMGVSLVVMRRIAGFGGLWHS